MYLLRSHRMDSIQEKKKKTPYDAECRADINEREQQL